jgi:hypothetical protein
MLGPRGLDTTSGPETPRLEWYSRRGCGSQPVVNAAAANDELGQRARDRWRRLLRQVKQRRRRRCRLSVKAATIPRRPAPPPTAAAGQSRQSRTFGQHTSGLRAVAGRRQRPPQRRAARRGRERRVGVEIALGEDAECRHCTRELRDCRAIKAVVSDGAASCLRHAWSGSTVVDVDVTALVLAAPGLPASVSRPSDWLG